MKIKRIQTVPISIIAKKLGPTDEVLVPNEIQIVRVGAFNHPFFGKFNITKKVLASFVKNWADNVLETDIMVDYSHDSGSIAAGWIIDLHTRADGQELWAAIDWTPKGRGRLAEKEFRYISADFTEDYQDNESGKQFGPLLFGCALTNRPFVKGMAPAVALSEAENPYKQGENDMTLEEQLAAEKAKTKKLADDLKISEGKQADADSQKELDDVKAENAKLKATQEKSDADAAKVVKTATFDGMLKEGKALERQRESFMADDMAKFTELSPKPDEINLEEAAGQGGDGSDSAEGKKLIKAAADDKDPDSQVIKLAKVAQKENKELNDGDAISQVLSENPELAKKINDRENERYG